MSTKQVASLLNKLDTTLNRRANGGKVNWKEQNEARKKAMWKPSSGKNQILVFTPSWAEDPFTFWGFHKGLQEVEYYSVPCDKYNKDEHCVICDVVDSLKKEDFNGNKHLWLPIEQRTETYVPIIDLTSAATMAEGPKWFRMSKTIMNPLIESLKNLEEGEVPFYDMENPQRIILSYDKSQPPATQYSVSLKEMKDKPSADQFAEWAGSVKPVSEYLFSKSQEDNKKLVDEYFTRMASVLDEASSDSNGSEEPAAETNAAESKLSRLKK